jgi:5'-3' exonuclease
MTFPDEEYQIEEAKFRIRNKLQEIQNNIEEWYNITNTFVFVGGKSNFRYKLYSEYKANRKDKEKSALLPIIKQYIVEEIGAIESHGAEADDFLYDYWTKLKDNSILATIDKDIKSSCYGIFYDYRGYGDTLGKFYSVTEKESRLNLATQIIAGDFSDNVKGAVGLGEAYCKKNLHQDMTNYQFIRAIFTAYLKSTKGDVKESKRQIRLNYKLLKLHTKVEVKKIIKDYDKL